MKTLHELLLEEEEKMLAQTRAEIAKEDAAWAALPQAEKDRISAEREAVDFFVDPTRDDDEEQEEDDDDDEDEEEE